MERMKDWQDKQAKRAMRRTLGESAPAPTNASKPKPSATPPAESPPSARPPTSATRGTSAQTPPPAPRAPTPTPSRSASATGDQPPRPRVTAPLAPRGTAPRPRPSAAPTPPATTPPAAPRASQPGTVRRTTPAASSTPTEAGGTRRARATEPPEAAELNAAPILELPRRPRLSRPTATGTEMDAGKGARLRERPEPTPLPARSDDAAAGLASLREVVREFRARLEARRGAGSEPDSVVMAQPAKAICPICGGAGYLRQELPPGDPFFGQPVPCKCKERELEERRWQELKRFSSLEPFADKTFETFHATVPGVREAYDIARRYASDPSQGWLVLSGPYGCGKTHLAAAIAHHHLATQRPVFFAVVPDLLHQLRAAFGPNSEISHDAMFDAIREVELLVLDDLGAENGTAWAQEKLFQIINYRYNYRMPTVITTNHQLQSRLDERLRSRLSDLSFVQYVVIKAGDYRPRNTRRRS